MIVNSLATVKLATLFMFLQENSVNRGLFASEQKWSDIMLMRQTTTQFILHFSVRYKQIQ